MRLSFPVAISIIASLTNPRVNAKISIDQAQCVFNYHTLTEIEFVYATSEDPSSFTPSSTGITNISTTEAAGETEILPSTVVTASSSSSEATKSAESLTTLTPSSENAFNSSTIDSPKSTTSTSSTLDPATTSSSSTSTAASSAITTSSSSTTATFTTSSSSSTLSISPTATSSKPVSASTTSNNTRLTSTSTSASATSSSFSEIYLAKHNYYRSLHEDTPELAWDDDIAMIAEAYADRYTCNGQLVHSGNSNTDGSSLGENLAYGYDFATAGAVTAWYNEIGDYDYSNPGFSESTGHFTQLIWKSSTRLGCAYRYCGSYYGYYIVCNYAPAGNVILSNDESYYFEQNVLPLKSSS